MLFDGSSSPEQFIRFGEGFVEYFLRPRAMLTPDGAILDLGCGNGSVARALTRYLLPGGRYEGLDVHAVSIEWLKERYAPYPNFGFTHANVYNKMYNPQGRHRASEYKLPFSDGLFDVVLLKSVFTHIVPADVRRYLKRNRALRTGGRSVITYFLLNEESRRFMAAGRDQMSLTHEFEGDPLCRVANPDVPESVIAHDERRIRQYYAEAGFSLCEMTLGDWCGRPTLLGLQDVVIAIRE
jgi:SAM-dependent methyltransferase